MRVYHVKNLTTSSIYVIFVHKETIPFNITFMFNAHISLKYSIFSASHGQHEEHRTVFMSLMLIEGMINKQKLGV